MKFKRWFPLYGLVILMMLGWYLAIQTPEIENGWSTTVNNHQPHSVVDRLEQTWSAQSEPPSSDVPMGWLILLGILIAVGLLVKQMESLLKQVARSWKRKRSKQVRPMRSVPYLEDRYHD